MRLKLKLLAGGLLALGCFQPCAATEVADKTGQTEILKWPDGKKAAISLTYDDGTFNQFKVALPIMEKYKFPATFFIITGEVKGSKYKAKFIGRPFAAILAETAKTPTNAANFMERTCALRFSGYEGMGDLHEKIGGTFEEGKKDEAYRLVDEAYAKIWKGEMKQAAQPEFGTPGPMSWDDFRSMAARGYELASHTVSHPYLSTFDDSNMFYELEKSRDEIKEQLGPKYIFSVEYPYGTEDKRVLQKAMNLYPLTRNLMADKEVQDLDRWNDTDPATPPKDYVRWQRGPLTKTPLDLMKKWVDTILKSDHVWLTLVFHGVDGIGWEPEPHQKFETYFKYIKAREKNIWVGTFQDVGKYIREKVSAQASAKVSDKAIQVTLTCPLSRLSYDYPLSLKTYVPAGWKKVEVERKGVPQALVTGTDAGGTYVIYQVIPNERMVTLKMGSN